jgi:hypothetical protein
MSDISPALSTSHSNEGDGVSSAPVPGTSRSSFDRDRDAPVYQSSTSQRRPSTSSNAGPSFGSRSQTPKPAARPTNDRSDSANRASSHHHKTSGLFNLHSISDAFRGRGRGESERSGWGERSLSRNRSSGLKAIRDALMNGSLPHAADDTGDNSDDETNVRGREHGWREFRPGTYSYPITVPIPVALPPSIHCDFGSVVYTIKASVQRAGALTSNLSAETEVQLVACPGEDDLEETDSIVVERFWETQLRYMVALSGKVRPKFSLPVRAYSFAHYFCRAFLLEALFLSLFDSSE